MMDHVSTPPPTHIHCLSLFALLALALAFAAICWLPATSAYAAEPTTGGKVVKIAAGPEETAYVTSDGALYLCGEVDYTQHPKGNIEAPKRVPHNRKIVDAAIAYDTCAFIDDIGDLYLYGDGVLYQKQGDVYEESGELCDETPLKVDSGVSKVAMGRYFCGYVKSGELYTFGFNASGYLAGSDEDKYQHLLCREIQYASGYSSSDINVPTKAALDASTYGTITDVTFAQDGSSGAIINSKGELFTFGSNKYGKLGDGSLDSRIMPQKIAEDVAKVSLADWYSGYLTTSGECYLFGKIPGDIIDGNGDVVLEASTDYVFQETPKRYRDGLSDLALAHNFFGFVTTDGALYMWGKYSYGKLGNGKVDFGDNNFTLTPVKVEDGVDKVVLGENHTLCQMKNGNLVGFGDSRCGQTANGTGKDAYSSDHTIIHNGHTHTAVSVAAVPATCTEPGTAAGTKCSECGEILSGCETVAALGHTPVTMPDKDATCTDEGYTAKSVCSRCNEVLSGGKVLPALEHDYAHLVGYDATCTEEGRKVGFKCTRCGDIKGYEVIPALGHDWKTTSGKAATCTEAGQEDYRECMRCGATTGGETIPALGHDFSLVTKSYKAPTYLKSGMTEERSCSMCGKVTEHARTIPKLSPKHQKLTVKTSVKKVSKAKLKKKARVLSGAIKVTGAKGTVTFVKASGSSKLSISKTGKLTVKKKTGKGTYSIKVMVRAAATKSGEYASTYRIVTVKVKVA